MKANIAKKTISLLLAVLILLISVPSVFAATPSKDELSDGYEYGTVLVSLNAGTASTVETLLDGFEIESIRLITPGSSTMNIYSVRFVEKTKEIVWAAIGVLQKSSYVESAAPNYYRGIQPVENPKQSETEEPEATEDAEFEPGTVIVSLSSGTASTIDTLLDGFEIESIRLITPGSSTMNIYSVRFVEKTKEIVWAAIGVLQKSSYVESAAPNYYRGIQPVENPKQSETEEPEATEDAEFEPGTVIVSLSSGTASTIDTLLDGFEIESIRLITPGSSTMNIYSVRFVEKTKEIVWAAIGVLQKSSYVESAAPNYYRGIQPDDSTEPPTDTTEPSILKGDADGDGYVSITDATTIQRYLVGFYDLDDEQLLAADTDGDGYVSITDVTIIQRYLVGLVENW